MTWVIIWLAVITIAIIVLFVECNKNDNDRKEVTGRIDKGGRRVDEIEHSIERIDSFGQRLVSRLDKVEQHARSFDHRTGKFESFVKRVEGVEQHVSTLDDDLKRFNEIGQKFSQRLDGVEQRVNTPEGQPNKRLDNQAKRPDTHVKRSDHKK